MLRIAIGKIQELKNLILLEALHLLFLCFPLRYFQREDEPCILNCILT